MTVAFAFAALAVPVSQAQLERLPQDGTQTQTRAIQYYPRLGLRVDSLPAGKRTFWRPDDRGLAAGIGNARTTSATQTKGIQYYPRLGLRVDHTSHLRSDDRGLAAGIGNARTTSSQLQFVRLPWEGGGAEAMQTTQAVRPDDRGEVAGIGIAPVTPQATASSSSSTDWTTLFVAAVAGLALVLLIGGAVAVTSRRHGENVAV